MLSDDIDESVADDLTYTRKQRNIKNDEFLKEILNFVNPTGLEGAKDFTEKFGEVIKIMHEKNELELIKSLSYSCLNIKKYEKAVHVFLQCFYGNDLITLDGIDKWYQEFSKTQNKDEKV